MQLTTGIPIDDLDALREYVTEHGSNPRVHPNGFIQLDLEPVEESWDESKKRGHSGADVRLHIWNPPGVVLPHQATVNEIHDHVFDMHSTVVRGRLQQRLYWFVVGSSEPDTHVLYRAIYDKKSSSRLDSTEVQGHLHLADSFWISSGADRPENNPLLPDNYTQPAFTFHDSNPDGLVVTVMTKTAIHEGDASVLCPIGQPPDNDFDRAKVMDEQTLWTAITESLTDA